VSSGQLVDVLAGDGRIEARVEVLEAPERGELGGDGAAGDLALLADVELVLQDQFEELAVGEPVRGGFLQPQRERLGECRQPQLLEDGIEVHVWERAVRL
jgi:hypothetical protein